MQLIVSDAFGNEFGPYQLPLKPGCKAPAKPKSKSAGKGSGKTKTGSGKSHKKGKKG